MIAVDTNVVMRFLLRDDEGQRAQAAQLLATLDREALVDDLTLAEVAWLLRTRAKARKETIREALTALANNDRLRVNDPAVIEVACSEASKHGFSIADGLIGARNRAAGCEATYTFDKQAARSDLFRIVP